MCFFQRTLPLVLSTHQRYRLLSLSATLRKMRLPQMIGVAPVLLGMESFQMTFSVVLQRSGRSFSLLVPLRFGPRHCGQFSAAIGSERAQIHQARRKSCLLWAMVAQAVARAFLPAASTLVSTLVDGRETVRRHDCRRG